MKKVIFDDDIGIDDAMALLFLHFSPDVELVAITTVFGNASIEYVTRNALFVKDKFNIAASVFSGASKPMAKPLGNQVDFAGKSRQLRAEGNTF